MKKLILELSGAALQHAVMLAEGWEYFRPMAGQCAMYGRTGPTPVWTISGPDYLTGPAGDEIIDRVGISTIRCEDDNGVDAEGYATRERIPVWAATIGQERVERSTDHQSHGPMYQIYVDDVVYGATRREAAMRRWVFRVLGEEVDIPEEML